MKEIKVHSYDLWRKKDLLSYATWRKRYKLIGDKIWDRKEQRFIEKIE